MGLQMLDSLLMYVRCTIILYIGCVQTLHFAMVLCVGWFALQADRAVFCKRLWLGGTRFGYIRCCGCTRNHKRHSGWVSVFPQPMPLRVKGISPKQHGLEVVACRVCARWWNKRDSRNMAFFTVSILIPEHRKSVCTMCSAANRFRIYWWWWW